MKRSGGIRRSYGGQGEKPMNPRKLSTFRKTGEGGECGGERGMGGEKGRGGEAQREGRRDSEDKEDGMSVVRRGKREKWKRRR